MKVLHIFTINSGGAAIAAKRIARAVEQSSGENVTSKFLAMYGTDGDSNVDSILKNSLDLFIARVKRKTNELFLEPRSKRYPGPFSMGIFGVAKWNKISTLMSDVDLIHVHWINRGFFSIQQFKRLSDFGKPIIWTMHDMWAFTGGCHYDEECKNYEGECINCKCIRSGRDDFRKIQGLKQKIFSKDNIFIVGCSQWITECARKSMIMKYQKNIMCIPNPSSTDVFYPIDNNQRSRIREKYNIPSNKPVVLFGAMSSDDERKGGKLLKKILDKLSTLGFHIAVFGNIANESEYAGENITILGSIVEQKIMHEIYAMSDVFIAPSVQENLANTVMEALSSGTPAVAFDIGGMPDMIIDNYNGRIVAPFDLEQFAQAVYEVSQNKGMRENAALSVKKRFSEIKIGSEYYRLYLDAMKAAKNNQRGVC